MSPRRGTGRGGGRRRKRGDDFLEDGVFRNWGCFVCLQRRLVNPQRFKDDRALVSDQFQLMRPVGETLRHQARLSPPHAISAARTVLLSSIAMVIGPTPPGFGVIAPATSRTASKSTSPTSR